MTLKPDQPVSKMSLSDFLENLPETMRQRRKFVLLGFILTLAASLFFSSNFKLNQAMTAFFDKDNQSLIEYNWFKYLFGSDESLVVMVKAKEGEVFSPAFLTSLKAIEDDLNQRRLQESSPLNRITRVRSIISADQLISTEDTLTSKPFIGDQDITPQSAKDFKKVALAHKDWPGTYISKDTKHAMVVMQTSFGSRLASPDGQDDKGEPVSSNDDEFDFESDSESSAKAPTMSQVPEIEEAEMEEYVPFIHEVIASFDKQGFKINEDYFMAGNPRLMGFFGEVIIKEIGVTMLSVIAIIWIVLTITFRSLSALVWPTVSLVSSLIVLFGMMGASGIEMTFMVNIIVFLLLAVTIATSIHIMSGYTYFLKRGFTIEESLSKTYRKVGAAIILAGVTTALGLSSLTIVPILAIRNFAMFAAIGVIVSLVMNLIMWPVFLSLWAPKVKTNEGQASFLDRYLADQAVRTHRNRFLIVVLFVGAFLIIGSGIRLVQVDSNFVEMIKEGTGFKKAYSLIDDKFGGTSSMEILIDTQVQDGVKRADLLQVVDQLETELEETFPLVTKVNSLALAAKESNQSLHGDDESYYKIPGNDEQVSHVLFNFESADPATRKLLVDDNWQILRLNVGMKTTGSSAYMELFDKMAALVESRLATIDPSSQIKVVYSGNIPLTMGLVKLISVSQIQSFAIALGVICLVMFLVFRSFKLGLIATIPNIFPLAIVMGFAGWVGIPLDADTLLVVPIAIGIAVDDTIHFLMHFRSEINDGLSVEEAIDNSLNKVGRAMFFTTVVLSLGFSVYLGSVYIPLTNFGIMSAIAVSSALIADLYLLPVLLRKIYGSKGPSMNKSAAAAAIALLAVFAYSPTAKALTADQIAQRMIDRDEGQSQHSTSIIVSCAFEEKSGKRSCSSSKRKKVVEAVFAMVDKGQFKKALNVIREPASDKGIAFLQQDFEQTKEDSLQWIFLPTIRKVKRIVSAESNSPKTGTLFGSEIAYEDLEKIFLDDFTYKLTGEEDVKGRKAWRLESKPTAQRAPKTSYSKSINWVDKESFIPLKTEMYDRQGKLAKTFYNMKLKKVDNIWVSQMTVVVNHKNRRMSMMKLKDVRINVPVPDALLSQKGISDKSFREQILQKIR